MFLNVLFFDEYCWQDQNLTDRLLCNQLFDIIEYFLTQSSLIEQSLKQEVLYRANIFNIERLKFTECFISKR